MSAVPHQWIISQLGARQHYGVPRGFETAGQLKRFYTDVWCPAALRDALLSGNDLMRAFAMRWHPDIPPHKVVRYNSRAIVDAMRRDRKGQQTIEQLYLDFLAGGGRFDQRVADDIQRTRQLQSGHVAFFGFNSTSLKTMRMLRNAGVPTVLDQIDPAMEEEEVVLTETQRWPGWQETPGRIPQPYWDHLKAEWAVADLVLVNSNWTKSGLVKHGVPAEKICIVAQAYEPDAGPVPHPRGDNGPLTILWLGSVILRKGIPYLMEAARLLKDTQLKFLIAGPIGISDQAVASAPPNMTFMGRLTRDQTAEVYRSADVFVLPTISDGFAATQLEAMSKGLPVIATPNCGQVVDHGKDGLIVPACDSKALAEAIALLDQDRPLLREMSHNAFLKSTQFLLPNQAREVEAAVQEMLAARVGGKVAAN
jgi:glycosyltransferase involved in cell wall biosynthesis